VICAQPGVHRYVDTVALVARLPLRHGDGRRLLQLVAGVALLAVAFSGRVDIPAAPTPATWAAITTVDGPPTRAFATRVPASRVPASQVPAIGVPVAGASASRASAAGSAHTTATTVADPLGPHRAAPGVVPAPPGPRLPAGADQHAHGSRGPPRS
jgi:hypothetical protein